MMDRQTQQLVESAQFGVEIETSLASPAILFILRKMAEREEEAIDALLEVDPDVEPHKIRKYQAEAKRFRAIQGDIEQIVNDGREAHRLLLEREHVEDV